MQQEMQNQEFNIKQDPYNYMLRVLFNRWKPIKRTVRVHPRPPLLMN